MKRFRTVIPFVFVLIAFAVYLAWMAPALLDSKTEIVSLRGQLGDSFGVLNSFFSGLGFAAIVVTLWIQQKQIEVQQEQIKAQEKERLEEVAERRSLFNMESAIDATERASKLLHDGNNDRRKWIEAARLLGHAKVLGEGVTIDCHQRVLEASKLRYRRFFSDLLENKTAAFFYGVDSKLKTFSAAEKSSAPEAGNSGNSISSIRQLVPESIYRVWEAGQWSVDFEDPVGPTFSSEDIRILKCRAEGLAEYIGFNDRYRSLGGQLHERKWIAKKDEK